MISLVDTVRRLPAWLVIGAAGCSLTIFGSVGGARADGAVLPVQLEGSGDTETAAELVNWQNVLLDADAPTDFSYYQRGTSEARRQLLDAQTDFALSAVPFTAAELAGRPAGSARIISAPVAVASLSIIVTTPDGAGWATERLICDPDDPDVEDPEACIQRGVFTGPIRIPSENLAALALGLSPSFEANSLATWAHPDFAEALGTADLAVQSRAKRHTFVNRTEGAAANKYLMTYAKELAPRAWALRKAENPEFDWDALGEQVSTRNVSRFGADTQQGIIAISNVDAATNATPDTWSGNMGAVPTNQVARLQRDYPSAGLREVEIQNRLGEYLTATPAAVAAAAAAGTDPLEAVTGDVPGGYPLVWTTNLYTVAGSLTPEEANSLAALLRYTATDGQDDIVADGGVSISTQQRDEALAAANDIVTSSCTVEGYEVTTGGAAGSEPDTPKVRALTGLAHCTPKPPPPTTTTTTTTTTAPPTTVAPATTRPFVTIDPFVPAPFVDSSDDIVDEITPSPTETPTTVVADVSTTTTTTTTVAAPSGGAGGRPRGLPLSALPMELPDDGRTGYQKLGTLLLGAAMYLAARRTLATRRLRSSAG